MEIDLKTIERLLITTYRKDIYRPFMKGIEEYQLINEGDKIAVCISGGKDSLTLAKLMQELQKHGKMKFELVFLVMNPGFNQINLDTLIKNAKKMDIPIEIVNTDIFYVTEKIACDYPCYICARMRRGNLYYFAKEKNCNKIALGHHFDDAIETILLNILYGGTYKAMLPKLKSTNFKGLELIRPMIYVKEKAIIRYMEHIGIKAMNCGCKVAGGELPSKRKEIKELIASLRKIHPNVDISIYRSSQNVNLNCVLGWLKGNKKYTYLNNYENHQEDE